MFRNRGALLLAFCLLALPIEAFTQAGRRFMPMDISYAVNRRHDKEPYYQGEKEDYHWLKPGVVKVRVPPDAEEVPFTIIDPKQNAGTSVIITRGSRNDFPQMFHLFPYARGVERVYILGLASGWGGGLERGTVVGKLRFIFDNGKEIEKPLRVGFEIDDWTRHSAEAVSRARSRGPQGTGHHIDVLTVDVSPHAKAMLKGIVLEGMGSRVSIPVFGVTLEVRGAVSTETDRKRTAAADLSKDLGELGELAKAVAKHGFANEVQDVVEPTERKVSDLLANISDMSFNRIVRARAEVLQTREDLAPWMLKRRFKKIPDYTKPAFPDCADYMILLERFPFWAERGWHGNYLDDPSLGYFGEGSNNENSLRTLGNFIFAYSLLTTEESYDPSVSGVDQSTLLHRARAALRYMTRSHVTGDIPCANGKRWGNHWQSAWWTSKMVAGAQLIWDELTPAEREAVKRVVLHEANRHLERKAPSGEFRNTRSEENAWDSEVLAWAACLYPDQENAKAWDMKAKEFFMNTLSVEADKSDDTVVDGKPVKDWVYTVNVHPDFTIENHGAYQFCYMACPLHSLTWAYYAYVSTGRRPPQSVFHHFLDVWGVIKRTYLYHGRFAYLGGKDWARYVYGLYFIMPPLAVLQNEFGDRDARMIEAMRFKTFEWEQRYHSDGGMFSGRYTNNIMRGWPSEYETDAAALLGLVYLLHKDKRLLPPADASDFQKRMAGSLRSECSEWAFARGPKVFASFSWRMLGGRNSMGLFIPAACDDMIEWGLNNLIGSFSVDGFDMGKREFMHNEQMDERSFCTTGLIRWGERKKESAIDQHIGFTAFPEQRIAVLFDYATAASDITVREQRGLTFHLVNDIFNGNSRRFTWDDGEAVMRGVGGQRSDLGMRSKWLNVDDKLGIIAVGADEFFVHDAVSRNAPWRSILYELICCPQIRTAIDYRSGEVVRDVAFILLAGTIAETKELAASVEMLQTDGRPSRALRVKTPAGTPLVLVANFAEFQPPVAK